MSNQITLEQLQAEHFIAGAYEYREELFQKFLKFTRWSMHDIKAAAENLAQLFYWSKFHAENI
jgi:hypothetical protein